MAAVSASAPCAAELWNTKGWVPVAFEKRIEGLGGDLANAALLLLGYGLCKTLTLDSYVTAFGAVRNPMGYVSSVPFMLAASLGILLTTLAILVWRRRNDAPFKLPYQAPLLVLACSYGISLVPGPPPLGLLLILGFLWGCCTMLVSMSFVELFSYENSPLAVILQLTLAMILSAAMTLLLRNAPEPLRLVAYPTFALLCGVAVWRGRKVLKPRHCDTGGSLAVRQANDAVAPGGFWAAVRMAFLPVLAYVFFESVIGLMNMYAYYGGTSLTIASSAPMWGMLVCAALLVAFVVLTNKIPSLDITSLVVFPIAIAVFLLLPFLGESMGPQLSVLIYTAYIFTSTLATFCYVRSAWRYGADPYRLSALVHLASRIMLVIGFAIGYGCAQLPHSEPLVRTGIVVAVCVYMLLFVVIVSYFKTSRAKAQPQVVVKKVVQSFEEANSLRLDTLAEAYGLTGRERDVYAFLLKGGTAKSIAGELGLSHYTVQGYIQGLYTKLGVNKKEQAVELFYDYQE